jgi:1,4-alpha-glucan branching enzyme
MEELSSRPSGKSSAHNDNRVIAFHRWLDGAGHDDAVVTRFNESTWLGYQLGFPSRGRWLEIFNGDVYDNFVNPQVVGSNGEIIADGPPLHGLPTSAALVIPANGVLSFARDAGE